MLNDKNNILVISVNTWNDEGGSNTLQNLFKHIDANNIHSLYLRSDLPNTKYCSQFYQIREISLFKKIFNRSVKVGNEVKSINLKEDVNSKQEGKAKNIYKIINSSFTLCLRELLWRTNTWKEDSLKEYIYKSSIDTIFVIVSSLVYSNRIVMYVKKLVPDAKVVLYFVDDNYTYKAASKSLFGILHRYFIRKSLNELVSKASDLFVISPKMKKEYDLYFNRETILLTKGVTIEDLNIKDEKSLDKNKVKLLYVGNLLYGRSEEMFYLAKYVDKLNKTHYNKMQFDVYTQTSLSSREISAFNSLLGCNIHKAIPYSQVKALQEKYDILIYAESFKKRYARVTRLSFSTKVTDYLSSGKVIWAIGPENIATIEYFKNNNSALVSTSREAIRNDLENILSNPLSLDKYRRNAIKCCSLYHDEKMLSTKFIEALK